MKKLLIVLMATFAGLFLLSPSASAAFSTASSASRTNDIAEELDALDTLIEQRMTQARSDEEMHRFLERDEPESMPSTHAKSDREASSSGRRSSPRDAPSTSEIPREVVEGEIERHIDISGNYRMAAGVGRHRTFSFNDSNSDFQDRDSSYLFGERLNNTFDPAIYSSYEMDVTAQATDRISVAAQINADPWSYVGTSNEVHVGNNDVDSTTIRLRYFGANNSTLPDIVRSQFRNQIAIPASEVKDGHSLSFSATGISSFNSTFNVPELEMDFEFRPLRKIWTDVEGDIWHWRVFGLADQNQVLTTDDPLGLSNTKDYWQPSPWLAEWVPIRRFSSTTAATDGAIQRGHYSDTLAFNAKTSYGEYLTLLRGTAFEADFGRAYVAGMIAAPYSPWDAYQDVNNMPGVIRLKHQLTPQWMLGGLYGFRVGMIDREPDAYNQVLSIDTRYALDSGTELYWQMAGSRDEVDRLSQGNGRSAEGFKSDVEGMAYRAGLRGTMPLLDGETSYVADAAWMGSGFRPQLSKYQSLRGDNFWSRHITFTEYSPDLEYFRIGTGLDIGRTVGRLTLRSELMDGDLQNLFDVRHVRSSDKVSFIENVLREEATYQVNPAVKLKGFTRWAILPETSTDIEPLLEDFNFISDINRNTLKLENNFIDQGEDPSTLSVGGGVQVKAHPQWTLEGTMTRTNDIPDFPRGLQNDVYARNPSRDPDTPNILIDEIQNFLYRQDIYGLPPYDYFSIFKEKIIFEPRSDMKIIFHAAQNSYKLWGPVDDMVNHQGVGVEYRLNDKTDFYFDYTRTRLADIPHLVGSGYTDLVFRDHHNVYASMRHAIRPDMVLNLEYGVLGERLGLGGPSAVPINPFSVTDFSLVTIDTEQIFRVSLEGEF